jgi:hypothetical protein
MRFLLGLGHIHKIELEALELVSGAVNALLGCVAVTVNGLRAAAAIFENQRRCRRGNR